MPGKLKILIVDDSPTSREVTTATVKMFGHEVMTASHGQEALQLLYSEQIDVVISDILMPVFDGFALCLEMKKDVRLKNIPLIFLSETYKNTKDKEFGLFIGAEEYLLKPLRPKVLMNTLARIFSHGGLVKDNTPLFSHDVQKELKEYSTSVYKTYNSLLIHKLEEQVTKREASDQKLHTLLGLSSLANESMDDTEYFEKTLSLIANYCNSKSGGIYLIGPNGFDMSLVVYQNLPDFYLETLSEIEVGFSFAGKAASEGKLQVFEVDQIQSITLRSIFEKNGIQIILTFPIASQHGILGSVLLLFEDKTFVSERQSELLISFGRQLGIRITHQKIADLIHTSREKLKAIFDGISDHIYVIDTDYRITSINKPFARTLNQSPSKIVGHKCYEIIWGRMSACEDCPVKIEDKDHAIRHYTLPDQQLRITELRAFPIKSEDTVKEHILYEKDITSLVTLEKKSS
ncbi:MAG: response regulator [Candidatus Aureabacteria bacterium]|nr:response regulator [Candidatus Auribacterota bacterium]